MTHVHMYVSTVDRSKNCKFPTNRQKSQKSWIFSSAHSPVFGHSEAGIARKNESFWKTLRKAEEEKYPQQDGVIKSRLPLKRLVESL